MSSYSSNEENDLHHSRALTQQHNLLQSQNYLEYHSAILLLLISMLRKFNLIGSDKDVATCLDIQSCIRMLLYCTDYHYYYCSMIQVQDHIRFTEPLMKMDRP